MFKLPNDLRYDAEIHGLMVFPKQYNQNNTLFKLIDETNEVDCHGGQYLPLFAHKMMPLFQLDLTFSPLSIIIQC